MKNQEMFGLRLEPRHLYALKIMGQDFQDRSGNSLGASAAMRYHISMCKAADLPKRPPRTLRQLNLMDRATTLRRLSQESGLSRAAVVRHLIDQYISTHPEADHEKGR